MFKDEPLQTPPQRRFRLSFLWPILPLIWAVGCSSAPASLHFSSETANRQYAQQFSHAYYSVTENGEYDVVLNEDGIAANNPKSSGPIGTSPAAPLNQIVHIRLRWKPLRRSKPDAPTATNSVIDWYVRANDSSSRDLLHYRGAGFVTVYGSDSAPSFVIRNAHVELAESHGRLTDPLGPSALTGTFIATRNPAQVTSTLNLLREQFAARP